MKPFKLPDLGEGLQEAELVEWQVAVGDAVEVDQVIVVVETAKAVVELPSPVEAVISRLCAKAGDTIHVGEVLVEFDGAEESSVSVVGKLQDSDEDQASDISFDHLECSEPVNMVGRPKVNKHAVSNAAVAKTMAAGSEGKGHAALVEAEGAKSDRTQLLAPPDIVAFARKLGLEQVLSSYPYGELSKSELVRIKERSQDIGAGDGKDPIVRLSGSRKVMAQAMAKSNQEVPSVSLFEDADIGHWTAKADLTVRLVRALIEACKASPVLNAWFDQDNMSIQVFDDIHVGIAVNSEDGLFVPVLRNAQALGDAEIRQLIDKLRAQVRERSIKPQKLLGATISLSNFGTLSGRYATPIIVPPQVAIVGVGKKREALVPKQGKACITTLLPISLSFDHRAATGAEAAAFLSSFIDSLQSEN